MRKLIQEGKIEFIDGKFTKRNTGRLCARDAKLYSNLLDSTAT